MGSAPSRPVGAPSLTSDSSTWSDRLATVEGPVAAPLDGDVLALSDVDGALTLQAVSGSSGAVRWTVPATLSAIPAGIVAPPAVVGGIALALGPGPEQLANGYGAIVEGVDVTSGRVAWTEHGIFIVTDPPTACPGPAATTAFCVVLQTSPTARPVFAVIDARTGKVEDEFSGVARRLADGLYESGGSAPNLVRISMPDGVLWSKPLDKVLGSSDYDLSYGWTIDRIGSSYLISVRARPRRSTADLSRARTVAVDQRTGDVRWRSSGQYRCGGVLPLSGPHVCDETGTLTRSSTFDKANLSRGATATLVGLDPATGRARWRVRIGDVAQFLGGGGYELGRGTSVVVPELHAGRHLIDLTTGHTLPVASSARFWCPAPGWFGELYPNGQVVRRVAVTTWSGCDENGRTANGIPPPNPAVGVNVGGRFVVASSGVLTGRPVSDVMSPKVAQSHRPDASANRSPE